uniref:Kringle domain-containing protein n=1 Tax=Ditylum brightwellii TaxID=49249 RepID=A0A7S4UZX0_9STRA
MRNDAQPGWASFLTGMESDSHNVDANDDMTDIAHPTVLDLAKDTFAMSVAAAVWWDPLITDFFDFWDPTTLDEQFIGNNDDEVTTKAEEWIRDDSYDFVFANLDGCDSAGHSSGFDGYANVYSAAVQKMDERVGRLLDAVLENSALGHEWIIVLSTDHGGEGTSHGGQNTYNRRIPLIVAGNSPRINIGMAPADDPGSHLDVTPTIMHFLSPDSVPSGLDGQVYGFADYTRSEPPQCQPDPFSCSCEAGQADYRGNIAVTKSGKVCQRWDTQTPHSHNRSPSDFPNAGLEENFCRNPDNEGFAWCYTEDPDERWEYCNIPTCPSSVPSPAPSPSPPPTPLAPTLDPDQCSLTVCSCEIRQVDYRGTIAVTKDGLPCQRWDAQSPHSHTRTASNYPDSGLEENYCRNPDGEDGVWCYTTSDVRWQLCDVPNCTPECCVSLAA